MTTLDTYTCHIFVWIGIVVGIWFFYNLVKYGKTPKQRNKGKNWHKE